MKKFRISKRIIAIILVAIVALSLLGYFTYRILNDENKLTVEEKEWITENVNKVQNIYVPNNLDVFGKNGSGVFYDFLESLETKENIKVHVITYNIGEEVGTNAFKVVYDLEENQTLFHKEHYVVISKELVKMKK